MYEIIIAGFGGQGVMSMGQWLAYAGMAEGKEISWLPSYGPEQRGGTANVSVVISDEAVGSPVITKPSIAVVLNNPSFDKFEPKVKKGGLLIVNASLVNRHSTREDIHIIEIPATEMANELGESKVANAIIVGALIQQTKLLSLESIEQALTKVLSKTKEHLIDLNYVALQKGVSFQSTLAV